MPQTTLAVEVVEEAGLPACRALSVRRCAPAGAQYRPVRPGSHHNADNLNDSASLEFSPWGPAAFDRRAESPSAALGFGCWL